MPFIYLDFASILELQRTAVEAGLANDGSRATLFSGIDVDFVVSIPQSSNAAQQVLLDLTAMNRQRRLTDGSVPLQIWLLTASVLTASREEQQVFRKYLDMVTRIVSGEPQDTPGLNRVPDAQERIVHQDDTLPLGFLAGAMAVCRGVVKVRVPRYNNGSPVVDAMNRPTLHLGTGWLLAPGLIMTNHHVVNARELGEAVASAADLVLQGKGASVVFDYDAESLPGQAVDAAELVAADATLDYAILRLTSDLGRAPLPLAQERLVNPQGGYIPVNIVQHPLGQAKMVAIRNNLVREISETEIQYFTDTMSGSSGSPVLDDAWRVVALHRASRSVDNISFQGKSTAYVNIGTPIPAICQHIRTNHPAVWERIVPAAAG